MKNDIYLDEFLFSTKSKLMNSAFHFDQFVQTLDELLQTTLVLNH